MPQRLFYPLSLLIIAILLISGLPSHIHAQASPLNGLKLAWLTASTLTNELWVSIDGAPPQKIAASVENATLSPDQNHLAIIYTDNLDLFHIPTQTIVANLPFAELETPADHLRLNTLFWLNESTVIFSTRTLQDGPTSYHPRHDLYRFDLSGQLSIVLAAGTGGEMSLSPNRQFLALSQAGEYDNPAAQGSIRLFQPDTGATLATFEFPTVSTGSETHWLPSLTWHTNSQSLTFILPEPDWLYQFAQPRLSAVCRWEMTTSFSCQPKLTLRFPDSAIWNDDLTKIAYIQTTPNAETWQFRFGDAAFTTEADLSTYTWPTYAKPIIWLDAEQLIIQNLSPNDSGLYLLTTSPPTATAFFPAATIDDLQRLNNEQIALAIRQNNTSRITVYDIPTATTHEIMLPDERLIRFIPR